MIFVITGTEAFQFNRLVKAIDEFARDGILNDEVRVQLGSCTYEPSYCNWDRYLPFDAMQNAIVKADMIIAHAGAGTTLLCLHMGKFPILVTRQKKYNEHLDDHQIPFARNMERMNYALVVYEISDLRLRIEEFHDWGKSRSALSLQNYELIGYLTDWLRKV